MKKFCFDLQVYSFHIDFMGHVNNIVYLQWLEIGRIKLLEAIDLPLQDMFNRGFAPVLVQTSIRYKMPLYLGSKVHIELWLSELRNASAMMQFQVADGQGNLAAEAEQKGLFVDIKTMRPRRLEAEERALFLPYLHG